MSAWIGCAQARTVQVRGSAGSGVYWWNCKATDTVFPTFGGTIDPSSITHPLTTTVNRRRSGGTTEEVFRSWGRECSLSNDMTISVH
ncbi:hypothetical protein [Rhodococcus sp. CH91]|uniref:hypothetical protein n=1 Tax=Rhodococcus sp. CH91 TaxID=2910256 RepID=UPI001F4AAF46|nr:hypothetical protein [Rhodococcus sp. CH91]